MNRTASFVLIASVTLLSGCELPRSGPYKEEVLSSSVAEAGNAYIVPVTSSVTRATAVQPSFGFSADFRNAGLIGSDTIASGDTLAITVFENVRDEPLLGNTGQRVTPLSEVQVDGQGFIYLPYAGRILAAGQTPEGLRQAITRKLEDQTPDPQVTVSRIAGDGSSVSIAGQAAGPGVYPIEAPTRTLATMLAKSGGVAIEPNVAIIRVTRGGKTGKIWLKDLYRKPELDIALRPGDMIVVEEDSRNFIALGATGSQTLVPFESETLSALEALATVGGLSTVEADPTGVFILRDESAAVANAVLGRTDLTADQRVVYVLDLTSPMGLFEARDFQIRDGDTLYVTEAPFVRWQKALSAITGTTGAATSIANTATLGN
ncbi:MAG: polysaccharide export protein [Rhodobacterales bacterium]|nr:polysaccharide export protein [Rhodobacterales bacterium]